MFTLHYITRGGSTESITVTLEEMETMIRILASQSYVIYKITNAVDNDGSHL